MQGNIRMHPVLLSHENIFERETNNYKDTHTYTVNIEKYILFDYAS